MSRICIVPAMNGVGGMASFRRKFEAGLTRRGILVTHDLGQQSDAVLVIAGTRALLPLWGRRRVGTRIVQRLDGINWIHKRRRTGLRHYVRAEYGNLVLRLIRARIATHIVYQSRFSQQWWQDWYGGTRAGSSVVWNGVDLEQYHPDRAADETGGPRRLLVVEGSLEGGYDMGLDNAVHLGEALARDHSLPAELAVVGKVSEERKRLVEARTTLPITWAGVLGQEAVIEAMQRSDLLFSADLHPACPNTVIEALACGLPVVAFDTGALRELVPAEAGRVVAYGGDPWNVDPPDIAGLAAAAVDVLRDLPRFRAGARKHAEQALGLERMVDGYLRALLEGRDG